ncbi:MAG: hypothetical protein IKP00_13555 [Victivallales bacterium]|nr:hypothetical protein [Victivallales bacterium]
MLENNEKIQGVDLKAVFTKMLSEVPWDNLKVYILSNAQIMKFCTQGGFRLDVKLRKRFEGVILREVEKSDYSEIQCNGVFAAWYPVHKELHEALETYFHSEEYETYRKDNGLGDDEYVLSDEKFNAFYSVNDFEVWRILLCFSPLKFKKEQVDKILEDKSNNADIMERLTAAESERDELSKKNASMAADLEKLRQKQQADQAELLELRKQLRQARSDADAAEKRVATAVAEMKRSNQQVAQSGAAVEQREAEVREELGRTIQRLQGDVERGAKEVAAWQQRYDDQLSKNRDLQDKALVTDRRCADMEEEKKAMERRLADCHKAVDGILSRIDWPHVGASMKMSPTVKRNFNSLLKRLDYDENRNLTIEATLGDFWAALSAKENALIEAIAKSTENEIINGSIKDYWKELADLFPDVQTSLEARIAMLSILQDIFYQTYTDEDLKTPSVVPKNTKKTKKAEE